MGTVGYTPTLGYGNEFSGDEEKLRMWIEQQRNLGRKVPAAAVRAMEDARLSNIARLRQARYEADKLERDRYFDRKQADKMMQQQSLAGKMSGLGQLAKMGKGMYDIGKEQGLWGGAGSTVKANQANDVYTSLYSEGFNPEAGPEAVGAVKLNTLTTPESKPQSFTYALKPGEEQTITGVGLKPGITENDFTGALLQDTLAQSLIPDTIGMTNAAEFIPGLYNAALPTQDITKNTLEMLPGLLEKSAMLEFLPDAGLGASALGGTGTQAIVDITQPAASGLGNVVSNFFQNPNIMGIGGAVLSTLGQTKLGQSLLPGGDKEDAIGAGAAGGAMSGSVYGPVGTVVGGVVGALSGLVGSKKGKTVICTALHHHGMIDDETYELDGLYGEKLAETIEGKQILYGYRDLFTGLAEKMKKNKTLAKIVKVVAMPIIKQMAHEVNPQREGSLTGKAMLAVGKKLCHLWFGMNIWKFIGREI